MKRIIIILIVCAVLFTVGIGSYAKASENSWPYIVFIDRPSTDWESVEELEAFLETDDTDSVIRFNFSFDVGIQRYGDCEDRAFQLREAAFQTGKRLESEILTRSECIQWREHLGITYLEARGIDAHVVCKAVIGNTWYFIDPENDEIWPAYLLD